MAQLSDHDMRLDRYSTLDTGHVIPQLYHSICAIWEQSKSRVQACNIMHQYMPHHPLRKLNPDMPTQIVLDVVFDVMMVGHRHWGNAQWVMAVLLAIGAMDMLSKQLDARRILDNRIPEEIAMDAILAARLAAEAEAARAAEHAGMTWKDDWPSEEAWDNGY